MNFLIKTIPSFFILILATLTTNPLGFAADEIGHGGGKTPIRSLSLVEASQHINRDIIRKYETSIRMIDLQVEKKKNFLPPTLIELFNEELSAYRYVNNSLIRVIADDVVPITDIARCGYKGVYYAKAFTSLRRYSEIYVSKNMLQSSDEEFAQILFHEILRHIAGRRLNCAGSYIHELSLMIFEKKSKMQSEDIAAHWLLKGRDLGGALLLAGSETKRNEQLITYSIFTRYPNLVEQEVLQGNHLIVRAIDNRAASSSISEEILNWYLPFEIRFRPKQQRIDTYERLLRRISHGVTFDLLSAKFTRKFKKVFQAMKKNWFFCTSSLNRDLETELAQYQYNTPRYWKLKNFIDLLKQDASFQKDLWKSCSSSSDAQGKP